MTVLAWLRRSWSWPVNVPVTILTDDESTLHLVYRGATRIGLDIVNGYTGTEVKEVRELRKPGEDPALHAQQNSTFPLEMQVSVSREHLQRKLQNGEWQIVSNE